MSWLSGRCAYSGSLRTHLCHTSRTSGCNLAARQLPRRSQVAHHLWVANRGEATPAQEYPMMSALSSWRNLTGPHPHRHNAEWRSISGVPVTQVIPITLRVVEGDRFGPNISIVTSPCNKIMVHQCHVPIIHLDAVQARIIPLCHLGLPVTPLPVGNKAGHSLNQTSWFSGVSG
jgi:hypothetical protein